MDASPERTRAPSATRWAAVAVAATWLFSLALAWTAGARLARERVVGHDPTSSHILVSEDMVRALVADHERMTGRAPTPAERDTLIEEHVTREILYREARALGLDEEDLIVRRRLTQKMEALLDALVAVDEPSVDDLRAWRDAHPERYREPMKIAFQHVFLADRDARGEAERVLGALESGADPQTLGDPFIRGRTFSARPVEAIVGIFGSAFAAALQTAPVGRWSGPVPSSFGLHLVRVEEKVEARDPSLEELAPRLTAEVMEERRRDARAAALAEMRARYTVDVEG